MTAPKDPTEPTYPRPAMVTVRGRRFRCPVCGANVFTELEEHRYSCNGCGRRYKGTK